MILENLKTAGVQQAHKDDKIIFSSITPWPGTSFAPKDTISKVTPSQRNALRSLLDPSLARFRDPILVAAAREAGDADFDVLIACAFNYEGTPTEFSKLGRIPVLKARMNADLHMADDLKNTGKGNLFVIFGEPDIDILKAKMAKFKSRSTEWMYFIRIRAKFGATAPMGSPAGSSTLTTTRKAFLFVTPISWVQTIRIRPQDYPQSRNQ